MSEEWKTFADDPRTLCKYGNKCYQKNPEHHKTYKHPPQKGKLKQHNRTNKRFSPYTRDRTDKKPEQVKQEALDVGQTSKHNENESNKKLNENQDGQTLSRQQEEAEESSIKIVKPISYCDKSKNNSLFKEYFLVEMPSDFFNFYECLSQEVTPIDVLLGNANLELIGPFDLLMGKLPLLDDKDLYLIHWRFFYDPPEFQAVLKKKGKSEMHIGYYRDDPNENPNFLARNDSATDCRITPVADNIFGAVYWYLQNEKRSSPFASIACQKLMEKIKKWAEKYNYSLDEFSMNKRRAKTVCKTFHGAGIVVPYDKKSQLGYRPLVESDAGLRKIFKKLEDATTEKEKGSILSELQPVITYANIAVDECDFGTGLEAGINLFCSGLKDLQSSALSCLSSAYSLLKREAFSKIIQVHLKHRRKGANMSVVSL